MERGHSQRQVCELIEMPRSILKYRFVRAERDAPALDAMRRIAATYPRYGYRRVRIFPRRAPRRPYELFARNRFGATRRLERGLRRNGRLRLRAMSAVSTTARRAS